MSLFFSAWQLVVRRSLANWRLLSSVVVGVFIAVALLSSAPFYYHAIDDLGLSHTLHKRQIELLDLQVYAPNYPVNYEGYLSAQSFVSQQVSRNIKSVVRDEERWIKSQTYAAGTADGPVPGDLAGPKGHFHVFANLDEHIKLVKGNYATPVAYGLSQQELESPEFAIEGMIGTETAEKFGVDVGDRLVFLHGYGEDRRQITIKLTALIEPLDPDEEYWLLNTNIFTVPDDEGKVAPIFIPEETLFQAVARIFPTTVATYHWFYYVDLTRITTQNAGTIEAAVHRMNRQLMATLPRSAMFTILDQVIVDYQGRLMFTQIPLLLLIFQIAAIILYYLVTVANMLIERQSGEIALLRSRGASTWQIIGVYFMEGLLISAIGAAVGPFLGAFVFSLLGKTAPFLPLTGGEFLPVRFSGAVFLLAAVAAVLCLLALLVPAVQAARRGMVHQRQQVARPPRAPLWQRFYLDLVLLAFGGVLYWELNERGSLLTMDIFGGLGLDPLLLVTPIIFMLGVAIVFLRLFPILLNLSARLARYVRSVPVVLGLWYMARNPVHYGRLILLLMMASAVGMFSATFLGTLERSYEERVMYATGSDIRLEGLYEWRAGKGALRDRYASIDGVEDVSLAYREESGTVGTMFTETNFALFAVDPESFGRVAWYREDFGEKSLTELMDLLAEDEPVEQGMELPDNARYLGVWVHPVEEDPVLRVLARVKDGLGHYIDVELGSTSLEGWKYIEAELVRAGTDSPLPPPLSLICIFVQQAQPAEYGEYPHGIYLDDLEVKGSLSAQPLVLEDFEDVNEWVVVADGSSAWFSRGGMGRDSLVISNQEVYHGDTSGYFSWVRRSNFDDSGIYPNVDTRPLMVVASRSFIDSAKVSVGSLVQVRLPGQFISVEIKDVLDYFPTLDPTDRGFLIANLDRVQSLRSLTLGGSAYLYPDEVWLSLNSNGEQREAIIDTLGSAQYQANELYDREAMITSLRNDPLMAAGWGGILLIAFMGVILVSGLGFVVYAYLSAQGRQLEFAILRTLGFSLRQIIGLVCFEQVFIIIAGMGLGTLIGERLSYIMMPFLQLTERGERVLPPFILTIDWLTVGIAYIILTAAFALTISLLVLFFSRLAIYRTLRMGDV